MEQITQLPWDQIALTGVPADSTDTNNPSWRVSGTSFSVTQDGGTQGTDCQHRGRTHAADRTVLTWAGS